MEKREEGILPLTSSEPSELTINQLASPDTQGPAANQDGSAIPGVQPGIYEHWGSGKLVEVRSDGSRIVLRLDKYS